MATAMIGAILKVKTVGANAHAWPGQEYARYLDIPVELTGQVSCYADQRIRVVEVKMPHGVYTWVPPDALCEEGEYGGLLDVAHELEAAGILKEVR